MGGEGPGSVDEQESATNLRKEEKNGRWSGNNICLGSPEVEPGLQSIESRKGKFETRELGGELRWLRMEDSTTQELYLRQERELEDRYHHEMRKGAWQLRRVSSKRQREDMKGRTMVEAVQRRLPPPFSVSDGS